MKWLVMFGLLAGALFLAVPVLANHTDVDVAKIGKTLPTDVFREASEIPALPHFLLGLEEKTDEWEQNLEKVKIFQTKNLFYGYNGSGFMDKSREDYVLPGNTELHEVMEVAAKKIKVLYTHHHLTKEFMYVFWSAMGEKNLAEFSPYYRKYEVRWALGNTINDEDWKNIQRVMGWAQFEAVKEFLHRVTLWALERNIKDYTRMNLTEGVIEARAKLLDDPNYKDRLDDPVPGAPRLKVRDILPVPLTRSEDFLPDLIIVGPRGFYGGFANFKTPDMERIVFFDMLGLALWHTSRWPMPAHEFVHTNPYLQGMPLAFYYDVEMWADLTTGLMSGLREFLFHPYIAVIRQTVKNRWGYDSEVAIRRILPGEFGVKDIREKEYREHVARIREIAAELQRFITDPNDGFMKQFYTDPYRWVAVNTKFCDTAQVWRMLFALRYEPAGIFDPEKKDKDGNPIPPVQQTKEWLMREIEAGRIKRLADAAMEGTGKESKFAKEMSKGEDVGDITKCPVDSRWFLMTQVEQHQFENLVKPLIERARAGDGDATIILMRILGGSASLAQFNIH